MGAAGLRSGRPHPEITKTTYRRNQVRQKSTRETSRGACVGRRGRGTGGAKPDYPSEPNDNIKGGPDLVDKHKGKSLALMGGLHKHGRLYLVLILPDESRSHI